MHVMFIPYGKRSEVELLLRDMEAQKHKLIIKKEGKENERIYIQGGVRILPFGVMEYVFPKEDLSIVLKTLDNRGNDQYKEYIKEWHLKFLRKVLKCKKAEVPPTQEVFLWIKDHVNIIIIGIKEDNEMVEKKGEYIGWTHEAI